MTTFCCRKKLFYRVIILSGVKEHDFTILPKSYENKLYSSCKGGEAVVAVHTHVGQLTTFEPRHVISNNVAFWQEETRKSLCSLLLSLETPNFVQLVA